MRTIFPVRVHWYIRMCTFLWVVSDVWLPGSLLCSNAETFVQLATCPPVTKCMGILLPVGGCSLPC